MTKTLFILVVFLVQGGEPAVETAMYETMDECRQRAMVLTASPPAEMGLDQLGVSCLAAPAYREQGA